MKHIIAIFAFLSISVAALAQNESLGCIDKDMRVQAETLKNSFLKQGLTVFKDAMITMERESPAPVGIQLVKGRMYQFIYIASSRSTKSTLELFDGTDKKITTKTTQKGGNKYIVYSFIPEKTDLYLVVLSQDFKGSRTACGSFTVMHEAPKEGAAK
jgi:hypothetical protein